MSEDADASRAPTETRHRQPRQFIRSNKLIRCVFSWILPVDPSCPEGWRPCVGGEHAPRYAVQHRRAATTHEDHKTRSGVMGRCRRLVLSP